MLKIVSNAQEYIEQRARGAYLATFCQPEASFDLFAGAQYKQPTKEDIARLNKRISWQITNISQELTYISLVIESMRLFVFVHGSFANNKDLSSQIGYDIVLANEEETNESFTISGNIIHWSSTKCKRIKRSILASEIYAMANGVDIAINTKSWHSLVHLQYRWLLTIDTMALRQAYEKHKISETRWIHGADNLADAMTKSNPNRALE
ncbi:hypothetical protein K3495_g1654 [Podosphaera aphanis]|nr:hypothetical protein K3495_g1654 [Podosphaera aphanis]